MKKFLQSRFVSEYGTLLVLLLLFAYYTAATWGVIHPVGNSAAREVAGKITGQKKDARVVIVVRKGDDEQAFAKELKAQLEKTGNTVVQVVTGAPSDASWVVAIKSTR